MMNVIDRLKPRWKIFAYAWILLGIALSPSCDNTGESDTLASQDQGEVVIGLTDAQGDFATYTIGVQSLTLTKANGTQVETVPLSSTVDFAKYTQMTEFFTVATIPIGRYVKATMVLDFSAADIQVEDAAGKALPVGKIVDLTGNPISTMEVSVHLEGRNSLRIVPGVPAHLTLDFDLQASNDVNFDDSPPTLTVEPFLLADLELKRPKIHRIRGPLRSVNLDESNFQVWLRPFFHRIERDARHFGSLRVWTVESTVYEIDGEVLTGAAGLAALQALPDLSAVTAIGGLLRDPRRFVAREVYAGSSVPGGDKDVIQGSVIARVGDVLTVKGATLIRRDGTAVFNDEVQITLDADTKVTKQAVADTAPNIADISVGSRIRVFGELINSDPNNLEMNASGSNNLVRLLMGHVLGRISSTGDALLVLDVKSINGRHVGLFKDFAGTGSSVDNDADPAAYEVATSTLDTSAMAQGLMIRVRGFVTAFGSAPADFQAQTIIDISAKPVRMGVQWQPATTTPFDSIGMDGLLVNLQGLGRIQHLAQGGVLTNLNLLAQAPNLVATEDGQGVYTIKQNGSVTVHTRFSVLIDDLNKRLDGVNTVARVAAAGAFDWTTSTLTSATINIKLKPTDQATQ